MSGSKKSFLRRMSVGEVFTLIMGLTIGLGSLVIGGFGASTLRTEKLRDTWSNVYLHAEHSVNQVAKALNQYLFADESRELNGDLIRTQFPDFVLRRESQGKWQWAHGRMPELALEDVLSLEDAQKDAMRPGERFTFWKFNGRVFLIRFLDAGQPRTDSLGLFGTGAIAVLWQFKTGAFLQMFQSGLPKQTIAYVVNRAGQLLWASHGSVEQNSVRNRSLVVSFGQAASDRMQIDLVQGTNEIHGVFHDIPGSNAMLFLEIPRSVTMIPLRMFINKFVLISIFVFCLSLVMVQWPLRRVTGPLKALARMSDEIARGNYQLTPAVGSFGEVRRLSRAFRDMTQALRDKDESIRKFLEDEKERIRLQQEISVAQRIQENLLPVASVHADRFNAQFAYIPAADVAGDWYSYSIDESNKRFIMVVADVSGHGAGSAMFTAVIAGLFQDYIGPRASEFNAKKFLERVHNAISILGKGQWHVTMCLGEYFWEEHRLKIFGAGCPPVAILNKGKLKWIQLRSDVLGIEPRKIVGEVEVKLEPDSCFIVHTDGLNESRNPAEIQYGRKRLTTRLGVGNFPVHSADNINQFILLDWRDFKAGVPHKDDVCLAVLHVVR